MIFRHIKVDKQTCLYFPGFILVAFTVSVSAYLPFAFVV